MIVVGGENLIDMVQSVSDDPWPRYSAIPGGAPYNVALALARQGVDVGYATPISTDTLGELLADRITAEGVWLLAERRVEPTSMAVVSVKDGIPTYAFYRDGTAERQVTAESLAASLPQNMSVLMVGGLAISEGDDAQVWAEAFSTAKDSGLMTALDPNIRPLMIHDRAEYLARFESMLQKTDLLKLSDEDLEWLYPGTTPQEGLYLLAAKSSALLTVITKGGAGALARAGDTSVHAPAGKADPLADTVGAGDTFMATLVEQMASRGGLNGLDADGLSAMLHRAATAAAINCERDGCDPPRSDEIDGRL